MFNAIAFQWPATFADAQSASGQMLGDAGAQISEAVGRLQATPTLDQVNSPVAGASAGSAVALNQWRERIASQTLCLCVHPWTQGVGQGESHIRYLSPANAVAAAAQKFVDTADTRKPKTTMEAVCIVISATSFKQLGEAVAQFCVVLPNPRLALCARRAQQLATLDRDKVELPSAPGNALWVSGGLSRVTAIRNATAKLGEQFAHAVGYEAGGISALDELAELATKKQQSITSSAAAITAFAGSFTGGTGKGVFISAKTPEQIKNELAGSGMDHDAPLACCIVYAGAAGTLQELRELLGL